MERNKVLCLLLALCLCGCGSQSIRIQTQSANQSTARLHIIRHPGVSQMPPLDKIIENDQVKQLFGMINGLPPEPVRRPPFTAGIAFGLSYDMYFSIDGVSYYVRMGDYGLSYLADGRTVRATKDYYALFKQVVGQPYLQF